jgi:hypothetical protein
MTWPVTDSKRWHVNTTASPSVTTDNSAAIVDKSVSESPIWAAAAPLTPLAAFRSLCVFTNTQRSRAL